MLLENLDVEKIKSRISEIDTELLELQKLEDEKSELEDVIKVLGWFYVQKTACETKTRFFDKGQNKWIERTPFATDQARKEYFWLCNFPMISLVRGWERAKNFVTKEQITLDELSPALCLEYENNGVGKKTMEFITPYLKHKKYLKHKETSELEALAETVPVE